MTGQHYTIEWLRQQDEDDHQPKYIFFWGHTPADETIVDKSCFSQWFYSPFLVEGISYPTAEHWMMARKALLFEDHELHDRIIASEKPGDAKRLGREVQGFVEEVWFQNRFQIVVEGNVHKFGQNKQIGDYLRKTAHRVLVEASPVDPVWGIGLAKDDPRINHVGTWHGQNLLGFALMEARDRLNLNLYK